MSRGTLFVLDGASASGKTTLAFALVKGDPNLVLVPRYTTRQPRAAASDALEYIFVTPERFEEMAEENAFIEYRRFDFGMSYGLAAKEIDAVLASGRSAVVIADLGRVQALKASYPDAVTILIDVPPDLLRKRLIARGTNTPEQIAERLSNATAVRRSDYDFVVPNDGSLDDALRVLRRIIDGRHKAAT